MTPETKSNIKIAVIAIVIMSAVFFGLKSYNAGHEAEHSHKSGEKHAH